MATITKTTRTGSLVEVTLVTPVIGRVAVYAVTLDGATVGERATVAKLAKSPAPGITHYLTSEPPVALTTAEADTLSRAASLAPRTTLSGPTGKQLMYGRRDADDRYADGIDDPRYWTKR